MQDSVSFLFGKSIHVTILFVSNRHCISPRLEYDLFHVYYSAILYVYVDGFRTVVRVGACFTYVMETVAPHDGRPGAS